MPFSKNVERVVSYHNKAHSNNLKILQPEVAVGKSTVCPILTGAELVLDTRWKKACHGMAVIEDESCWLVSN